MEGKAARRIDQIGDAGDIVIRVIAIGHRPDGGAVVRRAVAAVRVAAGVVEQLRETLCVAEGRGGESNAADSGQLSIVSPEFEA